MRFVFRWLLRIAGALVILAVLGTSLAYFLASRSLPDYNKTLTVAGISAPVDIVRDNADVPHIFGKTDDDSFFGLGYVHAQDRLWQMIVLRRTVQGRLSEIFGTRTVAIDKLMRRYGLYQAAQASVSAQDPRTLAALKAYAAGVNARLDEINRDSLGRGAPEMFLFNVPVAPWTPADSIAIGKLMALEMDGSLSNEVERARLSLALPDPKMVNDLMPDAPGSPTVALPQFSQLMQDDDMTQYASAEGDGLPTDPLSPFPKPGLEGASNAFAAAPQRSATGGTLLANDPHLDFTAPSVWYLARVQLQQGGVIGATIPGMPLILSGRSQFLGWGITASGMDDLDVYMEQIDPDDPEKYRTADGWKDFTTRKTIIRIKDAAPITLTLRWTDNGPVLPGSFYNLDTVTPAGHVASINWTALSQQDTTMTAGINLMYAKSVQQGIAAGKDQIAPSLNLMLADASSIAFKTTGAMPDRNPNHDSKGRMPTLGWRKENQWHGRYPYDRNPGIINPAGGILGNTNNKVTDAPFPYNVTFDWGDTQRIQRWRKLMESRKVHTRDSFIEAQLDTVSFTARSLLPLIGKNLWYEGDPAPKGTPDRMRQDALKMLANWNGEMNEHMPEPLIYATWIATLQDRLIRDELGPIADDFTHVQPLFIERVFRNIDGAGRWCNVVQTTKTETCDEIAKQSLDAALLWLKERYGDNLDSLRWGDVHQAAQDHPTLGEVPILKYLVNIRQRTSGGDNTLNQGGTKGTGADPFLDVHGAGYRGVYDFADPDSSVFIISTGQSGHPLSRHYDDLSELWRRGEYIPMSLDPALARAASVGETKLIPKK